MLGSLWLVWVYVVGMGLHMVFLLYKYQTVTDRKHWNDAWRDKGAMLWGFASALLLFALVSLAAPWPISILIGALYGELVIFAINAVHRRQRRNQSL